MRHPLGSSCRVTEEFSTVARKPSPATAVMRVRNVMAHGLRNRGRRPSDLESCAFSISFFDLAPAPFAVWPRYSGGGGVEGMYAERECSSIDPFRVSGAFQLKFPDRLLADCCS